MVFCSENQELKLLLLRAGLRVDALAEDEKALVQELRDEVDDHIERSDQKIIPAERVGQIVAEPGAQRSEAPESRVAGEYAPVLVPFSRISGRHGREDLDISMK